MTEQEAIAKMIAPGTRRKGKYREGVIQIWVTRACDKSCFACTQGSNLGGKPGMITPEQFEQAVLSLKTYWGVVGVFGGNPCTHPQFDELCEILRKHIPFDQRGLWSNNLLGHGKVCRETFDPSISNINVHLDRVAADEIRRDWPEARIVGETVDSRHSPPFVAIKDVVMKRCPECNVPLAQQRMTDPGEADISIVCETCNGIGEVYDESRAWELISDCDINKHWSAMIGVFRGEVRAWFCEIAGAQAMLHQNEPDYPDTGLDPIPLYEPELNDGLGRSAPVPWWDLPMTHFQNQVRKHCQECGVPLRGYGELAQATQGIEQVSATHLSVYRLKRVGDRTLRVVSDIDQLGKPLENMTRYLQNASK